MNTPEQSTSPELPVEPKISDIIQTFEDGTTIDFSPVGFVYSQLTVKQFSDGEKRFVFTGKVDKRVLDKSKYAQLSLTADEVGPTVTIATKHLAELEVELQKHFSISTNGSNPFIKLETHILENSLRGEKTHTASILANKKILILIFDAMKDGFEGKLPEHLPLREKQIALRRIKAILSIGTICPNDESKDNLIDQAKRELGLE